jgi:hypothetical protein
MRRRAHRSAAVSRSLWAARIWPLFAGAVTAVGVAAASNVFGWLALVVVYAVLSLFAVATVWGLSTEIGIKPEAVLRWGLCAALVLLVAVGLSDIHPVYGLLVGVAVGLSSPAALRLLARVRPRTSRRGVDEVARPALGVLVDKALLDRRFEDIVSQLRESGDFPQN